MILVLLVLAGLAILLVAGEGLVRGAVALSLRLGLSPLIVSLTVVAFGTSAPEMIVSVQSVIAGSPTLALGNVIGSNTSNILLVLGAAAAVGGLSLRTTQVGASYVQMLAVSALVVGLLWLGPIAVPQALFLLAVLLGFIAWSIRSALRQDVPVDVETAPEAKSWGVIVAYLAVGLIGLPLGAHLLITGATGIARAAGLSEAVIGLTLVAVGTSLPELTTSIIAAIRRHGEVALGNVVGSNLFNSLAILGVAGLIGPLPATPMMLSLDLWVMLGAALLMAPLILGKRDMARPVGFAFLAAYVTYTVVVISLGSV